MRTDTLIRTEGMDTLIKNLGLVEAERLCYAYTKRAV